MSAPVSHHPLVVNTQDGSCWTRRAVTSDGRGLYALAGLVAEVPDEVLTPLAELAELGITGSAFALPMPVGTEPRDVEEELIGANLSLYEEELDNARLRLALKSAQRGRRGLRARVAELEYVASSPSCTRCYGADAVRFVAQGGATAPCPVCGPLEVERLQARVAELEAERHTTNEALDDAVQALRANRDRIAELGAEKKRAAAHAERLATCLVARTEELMAAESADGITRRIAPTQALREAVTPRMQAMRALLDGQRAAVEDPHDGPLAHQYRVGRDLPEMGGTR